MEKIIITIIWVNIEFTVIQMIIFELENMLFFFVAFIQHFSPTSFQLDFISLEMVCPKKKI